ncbi:MAG: SCO family protein [Candidatus Delongbacteria bacterium]
MAGLLLLLPVLVAGPALAQPESSQGVAFDEHLGEILPGEIVLRDEAGNPVQLAQLVDRPTILNFVYFDCPGVCTPLLNEVADVLGKSDLDPRREPFQILTVSFEPRDTPQVAAEKRANYLALLSRPLPPETWRFLTGDAEELRRLTAAAGFSYKKAGFEYIHPGGLILLSPERKIVRYLYGTEFLPFDFKMGVLEAAKGTVLPTTARLLTICFSYDPQGRTYVFNLLKVVGGAMLSVVGCFGLYLLLTARRGRSGLGRAARRPA